MLSVTAAKAIAGTLGFPSKMPGTSWSISAKLCVTGGRLAKVAGSVCHGCYALKDRYTWTNAQKAMQKRLDGISDPRWVEAMITLLRDKHSTPQFRIDLGKVRNGTRSRMNEAGWHRWFDSGDLQGVWHLDKICAIAHATPKIKHWLATREAKMVASYVASGGVVPDNLVIRVSATMVGDRPPTSWKHTSTVHTGDQDVVGHLCPAPTQGNACGSCRACWSPDVKNVSYHLH